MKDVDLLPESLRELSISEKEIVLPLPAALEAIDFFAYRKIQILGWEGWVKDAQRRIGHDSAPQGAVSLEDLSIEEAITLCRSTILSEATNWEKDNQGTSDILHICFTIQIK
jgi:hypothetical protein